MPSFAPPLPNYPVAQQPITPLQDPMVLGQQTHDILNNAIPGLDNLTGRASSNVGQLLSGLPSAAPTQTANAYFGANSGMPGSDFVRNRGYDLYNQKAEQYKSRGFDDFLNLLKGASGTIAPTPGEQAQNQQFGQNLRQRQFEANNQTARYNADYSQRPGASTPGGTLSPWGSNNPTHHTYGGFGYGVI